MPTPADEQALLEGLRAGNQEAAQKLFATYAGRLMRLARARINQRMARRIDPEDVVQSVFRTFFSRVKTDQFTFENQDDLVKVLVSITIRKALRQVAFHRAAKRDPGLEEDGAHATGLPEAIAAGPSPEATVAFLDQLEHLLAGLRPRDRAVLEMRLEGYRNEEIARKLDTSDRHVRRVLEHIRMVAEQEEGLDSP